MPERIDDIKPKVPSDVLIRELHRRGVEIETIFAHYYALDEMNPNSTLTVGDVELVGLASLPTQPVNQQPF